MAAKIKIVVGAALDRSVDAVFASVEKRAQRTQKAVERAFVGGSGGYRSAPTRMPGLEKASASAARRVVDDQAKAWRQIGKLAEAELTKAAKAGAREQMKASRDQARQLDRFATRTSHRATRFALPTAPLGSMAKRVGSDLMRGIGVDFSLGSALQRSVGLQRSAIALSNQGFQAGSATNGKRVGAAPLIGEARAAGEKFGTDPAEMLDALGRFTSLTGDLATGRSILTDMASLATATGASVGDMADAYANASNSMEDTPDKAAKLAKVMRVIAGQGKLGAVEIKDLAVQMAKVSASAAMYEGDAGDNIVKLGALMQLSRQKGGAASASQAATSIAGLANTFKTPARVAEFKAAGIDVYNAKGQIRDPVQLIREAINKTGGDPLALKKMFANVIGAKPVEALATTYRQAGGGMAGDAAIMAELQKFTDGAAISQQELDASNKAVAESTAAKAQKFQNQLDSIAESMATKVLPELEKLAPVALEVSKSFAGLIAWVAGNPWKAVGVAAAGAVSRAIVESFARAGIEKIITGAAAGWRGGAGVLPGGGAPGAPGIPGSARGALNGMGVIPAAALALGGLEFAREHALKLGAETNVDMSRLLPGVGKDGKFSFGQLGMDAVNPLAMVSKIGGVAMDVASYDSRANTQAKAEAAARQATAMGASYAGGGNGTTAQAPMKVDGGKELLASAVQLSAAARQLSAAGVDPSGRTPPPGGARP